MFKCQCNRPNCSHVLPEIDYMTSSTIWGTTYAERVIAATKMHKKYGCIMLQDLEDNTDRGKYDIYSFLADTLIGDRPWRNDSEFEVARDDVPGYKDALQYLHKEVPTL